MQKWKKKHQVSIILILIIAALNYNPWITLFSGSIGIQTIGRTLILFMALGIHYLFINNLEKLLNENSKNESRLNKLLTASYFSIIVYFLSLADTLLTIFTLYTRFTLEVLPTSLDILHIGILGILIYLLINSQHIFKSHGPTPREIQKRSFIGSWKSAIILAILGFIRVGLKGLSDPFAIVLIITSLLWLLTAIIRKSQANKV